ncbi:hypothetical protein BAUCODRAFT_23474 [Baudoinia panamericana UAMH 10762]|uniref:Zn(2)-C6 fungal-type domain-containing protein n=1 Tax=Baudoinia panamericana (strain UAMH 10762) TaxID=717646 RepID=M2NDV6_BAUPA|nr:uncharacterized protein BAUCODRAFT_23474 [Baudoinia panamericana UAMH 10762]EMC97090.1 hypothetical protein BAUCODRAFT_23474 [Baudoinia panamericana UAMH 10762]
MAPDVTSNVRPRSPEASLGSDRKRRRKVLSCYDCRRRKLQCDRAMPACSRCTKAGQAANCLYLDEPIEGSAELTNRGPFDGHISRPIQPGGPVGDTLARLEYQDRRIKQLETALAQASNSSAIDPTLRVRSMKLPLTPESFMPTAEPNGATINDRETMLLRGTSFKTRFHGSTHPASLIAHIPEFKVFTRETFDKHPTLHRIRQDMQALEDRTDNAGSTSRPTSGDDLKALLPEKAEADELIKLYLDSYGTIYHIVHMPSFRKEYDDLWEDRAAARPHFVAVVLLMMGATQCLTTTQPWLYFANSSAAREKAVTYIQACDDWLQAQSQKHVTAADFQIRFLLALGRVVSARKYKRAWTDAGTLLRFCMAAGLHRNPELIRKETSALDKELRRRIWAAVVELELQASFGRGMVCAPWPMQADCPPPSNISDDDIDQPSERLPNPLRIQEFTMSSYLALVNESVLLRHSINTMLNNIRQTLTFDDAKRFTEEIQAYLQAIPQWTDPRSETARALLTINLRQYLLALHDRQIRQADTMLERSFSRMILVDTATRIMKTHKSLIDKGNHALEIMCRDHLRAALSICYVATTIDLQAESGIGSFIEQHADRVMEDAISMLTDKTIRFGREQRQLWIALAAHGLWKAKKDPSRRAEYMQEAVDKITRPYYKIMACQEEGLSALQGTSVEKAVQRAVDETSNAMMEYPPLVPPTRSGEEQPAPQDAPLIDIDLDEIEAWTFDSWPFNPTEMQQAFAEPSTYYPPVS